MENGVSCQKKWIIIGEKRRRTAKDRIIELETNESFGNTLPLAEKILELKHVVLEGGDLFWDDDKLGVVFEDVPLEICRRCRFTRL
jgi:hypothetical protein